MRYKPNFSARMIAVMNVAAYHWELVVRETANIDRLAQDCLYRTDVE